MPKSAILKAFSCFPRQPIRFEADPTILSEWWRFYLPYWLWTAVIFRHVIQLYDVLNLAYMPMIVTW